MSNRSDRDRDHRRAFHPPSSVLRLGDGVWTPENVTEVSYPEDGNDACFAVEERSYWFHHRNDVIVAAIRRRPPSGTFFDVGGGNGFVAKAIQDAGFRVALVEPGRGAFNALRRGVTDVVRSTLEDAAFDAGSIGAIGVFDVVEHVRDEDRFLSGIRRILAPGGRVYCTVPAGKWLWSRDDVSAGHFRRHTARSLRASFRRNGFEIEYLSHFFCWLPLPVFVFRTLPSLAGIRRADLRDRAAIQADHSLPAPLRPVAATAHRWELNRIGRGASVPVGSSLICVARHD